MEFEIFNESICILFEYGNHFIRDGFFFGFWLKNIYKKIDECKFKKIIKYNFALTN